MGSAMVSAMVSAKGSSYGISYMSQSRPRNQLTRFSFSGDWFITGKLEAACNSWAEKPCVPQRAITKPMATNPAFLLHKIVRHWLREVYES